MVGSLALLAFSKCLCAVFGEEPVWEQEGCTRRGHKEFLVSPTFGPFKDTESELWSRSAADVFSPAASTFLASKTLLCAPSASLFPPLESVRMAKVHVVHVSHAYFSEKRRHG